MTLVPADAIQAIYVATLILLTPTLKIAEANDAYLSVTMTRRNDIADADCSKYSMENPSQRCRLNPPFSHTLRH